jgi:hypothetical protein
MMSFVSYNWLTFIEGDKEVIIEALVNGHISEEVMEDYQRRMKQRLRSAFDDESQIDP